MPFNSGRTDNAAAQLRNSVANRPTYYDMIYGFEKEGGTKSPDAPTLMRCNSDGSMIFISWDRQYNLTNFKYYEVQVSDDGVDWYSIEFDGTDWKDTLDATTIEYGNNLLHTKIPYNEDDSGRTLSYRVRTVTYDDTASDWSNVLSATTGFEEYFYHIYYGGGGLAIIGGATTSYVEYTNHYIYEPTGGIVVSGEVETNVSYIYSGNGTVTASGNSDSDSTSNYFYDSGGTIIASGNSDSTIEYNYTNDISYTNEIDFGSEYTASSGSRFKVDTLDNNHIVCIYYSSGSGKVKIGTIAGDYSITFGTEYSYSPGQADPSELIVLDDSHIVISYRDSDGSGRYSIVGVVNLDYSITFGTRYLFDPGNTLSLRMLKIDSNHFIISFDADSTNYGTSIIGTISNDDEISFTSEYIFNSDTTGFISMDLIDSSRFVVFYRDGLGKAKIGTIAGDYSITFGSAADIGSYIYRSSTIVMDNEHFVTTTERSFGSYFSSYVGTIDGTSITFSSPFTWTLEYIYTDDVDSIKVNNEHFIISYASFGVGVKSTFARLDASNNIVYDDSSYEYEASPLYYASSKLIDDTHIVVATSSGTKVGRLETVPNVSVSGSADTEQL